MTLLLVACTSSLDIKDSVVGQGDSVADTADTAGGGDTDTGGGDTDSGDPLEELGFEYNGTWYDLQPADSNCQQYGGIYAITSSPTSNLVVYAYFGAAPEPGDYTVVEWTGMESSLEAGTVGFAFVGLTAEMPYGNSTGTGGSVVVFTAEPNATVVSWTDLALADYDGNPYVSTSGMVACL